MLSFTSTGSRLSAGDDAATDVPLELDLARAATFDPAAPAAAAFDPDPVLDAFGGAAGFSRTVSIGVLSGRSPW